MPEIPFSRFWHLAQEKVLRAIFRHVRRQKRHAGRHKKKGTAEAVPSLFELPDGPEAVSSAALSRPAG
jgi:hypothetical protein